MGRRCSTAEAATASGGATMAPNATAAAQGRPGISSLATAAMNTAVNSTQPTASSRIGRRLERKARQSVRQALPISSGGSSVTEGRPGMKAITMPPSTRITA